MSIQIIPAILTDDVDEFEDKLHLVEDLADRVQIDYVDGYFSPEVSCCEAHVIREINSHMPLEVQLMVVDPTSQIDAWVDSGVERIIGHIEEMEDQIEFVEKVSEHGMSVGLALNIDTPLSALDTSLLPSLDVVLLMAHEVGVQGGAALDEAIYEKIRELRDIDQNIDIEIDGGVNDKNAKALVDAGATILAVGSDIFAADDPVQAFEELRTAVRS